MARRRRASSDCGQCGSSTARESEIFRYGTLAPLWTREAPTTRSGDVDSRGINQHRQITPDIISATVYHGGTLHGGTCVLRVSHDVVLPGADRKAMHGCCLERRSRLPVRWTDLNSTDDKERPMNRLGFLGFLGFLGCLGFWPGHETYFALFLLCVLFGFFLIPRRHTEGKQERTTAG
jgi:hypothetical protein